VRASLDKPARSRRARALHGPTADLLPGCPLANLFIAYVLAAPEGYRGDMFLFTVQEFASLVRSAPRSGEKGRRKVYLSRLKDEPGRWVLRTASRKFDSLTAKTVIDVTDHRQAFHKLLPTSHGK
jgi:hypothetical protein